MKNKIRVLTIIFLLVFPGSITLGAVSSLSLNTSLTVLGNADADSAPSPLLFGGSVSVPFFLSPGLYLKSALGLMATNYRYNGTRAVPAEVAHREYLVLMPVLDCLVGMEFHLIESLDLGVAAGPAFLLRIPISIFDNGDENYDDVLNWFYSDFKFLYPACEIYLKWQIEENFGLVFYSRGLYPLFNIWSAEDESFWDQMMISGGIGFIFSLPGKE